MTMTSDPHKDQHHHPSPPVADADGIRDMLV